MISVAFHEKDILSCYFGLISALHLKCISIYSYDVCFLIIRTRDKCHLCISIPYVLQLDPKKSYVDWTKRNLYRIRYALFIGEKKNLNRKYWIKNCNLLLIWLSGRCPWSAFVISDRFSSFSRAVSHTIITTWPNKPQHWRRTHLLFFASCLRCLKMRIVLILPVSC